jgi:hypothetical protein
MCGHVVVGCLLLGVVTAVGWKYKWVYVVHTSPRQVVVNKSIGGFSVHMKATMACCLGLPEL